VEERSRWPFAPPRGAVSDLIAWSEDALPDSVTPHRTATNFNAVILPPRHMVTGGHAFSPLNIHARACLGQHMERLANTLRPAIDSGLPLG
jgi:hypothetical protein